MMFDPEKVERVTANANFTDDDGLRRYWDYDVVRAEDYDRLLELYRELERELRSAHGLKALLANGMPPTGNAAFDEILATHPIAAMIQRGWLDAVTGFDDLPSLEWEICHFYGVTTIEEAVNPPFPPKPLPASHPPAAGRHPQPPAI